MGAAAQRKRCTRPAGSCHPDGSASLREGSLALSARWANGDGDSHGIVQHAGSRGDDQPLPRRGVRPAGASRDWRPGAHPGDATGSKGVCRGMFARAGRPSAAQGNGRERGSACHAVFVGAHGSRHNGRVSERLVTARKRVLVLGGGGMLGHKLFQVLQEGCDTYATFRQFDARLRMTGVFDLARVIDGVDAWDMTSVRRSISEIRPDWVVNCIGVIKQLEEARDAKVSIYVNALFPHLLGQCSRDAGVRMIHLSTDCVFSGKKGDYVEEDPSDADDLYGKTKYLGEVSDGHALTLRTSIIDRKS